MDTNTIELLLDLALYLRQRRDDHRDTPEDWERARGRVPKMPSFVVPGTEIKINYKEQPRKHRAQTPDIILTCGNRWSVHFQPVLLTEITSKNAEGVVSRKAVVPGDVVGRWTRHLFAARPATRGWEALQEDLVYLALFKNRWVLPTE
jgi:hypothetical protein